MDTLSNGGNGNYGRSLIVDGFSGDVLEHARSVFEQYKSRGVLLNDSFDDDIWHIDDQKRTTGLMRFQISGIPSWIGCPPAEYRAYVKAYIALRLGELSAFSLQEVARELLRLTEMKSTGLGSANDLEYHISEFLQLLPGGGSERDDVIEQFSEQASAKRRSGSDRDSRRVLADFQSYLRFNDALSDFWAAANAEEKLFYFPLYFWWNLTTILPLRVTEFLLTPRDCVNGNTLSVRRTKLKGDGAKVSYRVADDYAISEYTLTDALVAELNEYKVATDHLPRTHIDTLFKIEPHYDYLRAFKGRRNRYYTYFNLNTCFRSFLEIARERTSAEISPLHLGDTRHIAMISLISSGGSPTICRELAGHLSIGASSHYYTNFASFVKCVTLDRLDKARGGAEASIEGKPQFFVVKPKNAKRVSGGLCGSDAYARRDVSDCLKVLGPNGEIGECSACPRFFPNDEGLQFNLPDDDAARAAVDEDSRYFMQMVESVRKGLGYDEDIGAALLRLQHSAYSYSMRIRERMEYGAT